MAPALSILLIDDDENDRTLFTLAVKKCRQAHLVSTATGAKEAIRLLEEKLKANLPLPDLFMVDLRMPGMSGFEFLSWLKQQPNLRSIPAISFSASIFESDVKKSYELGASGYLIKPTKFDELITGVISLFDFWTGSAFPRPVGEPGTLT